MGKLRNRDEPTIEEMVMGHIEGVVFGYLSYAIEWYETQENKEDIPGGTIIVDGQKGSFCTVSQVREALKTLDDMVDRSLEHFVFPLKGVDRGPKDTPPKKKRKP